MNSIVKILAAGSLLAIAACSNKNGKFDASGTFEADEVIVSSELPGKILRFDVEEGQLYSKDSIVGILDAESILLQKEQVQASIRSLGEKTADVTPQVKLLEDQLTVQQSRLNTLLHEKTRIENLLRQDAATGKQLDDINAEIDVSRKNIAVTQQQIHVQKSNVATQNRGILSEGKPLEKRVAQLDDQLKRTNIINPVNGTVITK